MYLWQGFMIAIALIWLFLLIKIIYSRLIVIENLTEKCAKSVIKILEDMESDKTP